MNQYSDIPYVTQGSGLNFHLFDLYIPFKSKSDSPLICFVHGGAWRTEDKSEHIALAHNIANFTQFPVAVPNYRLTSKESNESTQLQHPAHAEDLLQFLNFIVNWKGPHGRGNDYDPQKIYLIGHSCGAHMLSSILLDSSFTTPSLIPSPEVISATRAVIMSEGIYDLDVLLATFPDYREWFVADAFGVRSSYAPFSATTLPLRKLAAHIRWFFIHSKGDTLVDSVQSEAMYEHLCGLYGEDARTMVFRNMEELNEPHDDVLRSTGFVRIVGNFLLGDSS